MAASTNLTPKQRVLRAKIAANATWAREPDRVGRMEKVRNAAECRFEKLVDPDGILSPEERARRAANARRSHMQSLALKSAQARAKRSA
ncbi:hypothetical protein DMH03_17225 [Amycolatopsis sp. WAC 01376]|uniref:hypothetical protein n=1 Tax=Amycolatopsis sp. WAC 01376 TaxID=2203195 RepID=UPI000F77C333|nr:hypothetical protein [Amycolatopsis sp. WAC 01376]RSM60500.1 hypothetical protein DMH03_17225 [Amycolatopsis sp. WAC 01376]